MTSEEFKVFRKKMGLTQVELAGLMGMTQSSLARIESGARNPTRQHEHHLIALFALYRTGSLDQIDAIKRSFFKHENDTHE